MVTGHIFDIQRFSIHDGPGIRTTVFFKGCPLRCSWCHNPESWLPGEEPAERVSRCVRCGRCVDTCPEGAVTLGEDFARTDVAACTRCGACIDDCPVGAREILGRPTTAEEVVAEVERDLVFFEQSGGGVTCSGGEPLYQPEFLGEVLALSRKREISTALDTTCHARWETIDALRGSVDLFLVDLKHLDAEAHRRLTGVGNERILENVTRLGRAGARMYVRVPILPGLNDDEPNIRATARLAASLGGVERVDLLPYHEPGRDKMRRLVPDGETLDLRPPTPENTERIAGWFRQAGLTVKIGG